MSEQAPLAPSSSVAPAVAPRETVVRGAKEGQHALQAEIGNPENNIFSFVDKHLYDLEKKITDKIETAVQGVDEFFNGKPVEASPYASSVAGEALAGAAGAASTGTALNSSKGSLPPEKLRYEGKELLDHKASVFSFLTGANDRHGNPVAVSSHYGVDRVTHKHGGVDVASQEGNPLVSTVPLKVLRVHSNAVSGNFIVCQRSDGIVFKFLHLKTLPPWKVGATIAPGKVIGVTGNTGRSTGPHLHFEAHKPVNGQLQKVNPLSYLPQGVRSRQG